MNYDDHITHWRGTPLKNMSRDDLVRALQLEVADNRALTVKYQTEKMRGGKFTYEQTRA